MKNYIMSLLISKVIQEIDKEDVAKLVDSFLDPLEEKYKANTILSAIFAQIRAIGNIPEFED